MTEAAYYPGSIVSIPSGEHEILALLHHGDPDHPARAGRPAVLRLHGLMGNLLDETEAFLSEALISHGITSMTINTLLSNLGLVYGFGIFEDAMPQIATAISYLREAGHNRVVVAGHGLGACMAIRYGALSHSMTKEAQVDGVIGIAPPWSLPETVEARWDRFSSSPSYRQVCDQVQAMTSAPERTEAAQDRTILIRRAHGETDTPQHTDIFTLRTWDAIVGPDAEGTRCHLHIGGIASPTLLISGTDDTIVPSSDIDRLAAQAEAHGRTVDVQHLPADHTFSRKHAELAETVVAWIEKRVEAQESAEVG